MKMIHKIKNAECVETLINFLPENPDSPQVEGITTLTTIPHNGKDPFNDLQDALAEKDIIILRAQLHDIITADNFMDEKREAVFDLAEKLKAPQFLEDWDYLGLDSLLSRKPLPRIHIHHHRRADTENIHRFYVQQIKSDKNIPDLDTGQETDDEFPYLEAALKENDIIDLRETLKQITRSLSSEGLQVEEIDNYLTGNMTQFDRENFENELNLNSELKRNVGLYADIDEALHEKDVIEIRGKLEKVIQSQHSTSRTMEEVDAFVAGELPENERDAFIAELAENDDLKAEVNLSKNLDKAFMEKDIHHLRTELNFIAREMNQQSTKSLILLPEKHSKIRRNGTYAAILLVLIGLSSVLWQNHEKDRSSYDEFFKAPQAVSSFRSVGTITQEDLSKGFELYNKSEFVSALQYFDKILQTDEVNPIAHYWAGLTNRQMQRYPDAWRHFQQVMNHHNNLFVEQAEWFSILCVLKMSGKDSVANPLEAIIDRKGYYYKDALILKSRLLKDD